MLHVYVEVLNGLDPNARRSQELPRWLLHALRASQVL